MNKGQLAELYSKKDYPIDEYIALPVFAALEADVETLEVIEEFRLPEITKLICCSKQLSQYPWAEKYVYVRPLYRDTAPIDAVSLFEEYPDPKVFDSTILTYIDPRMLSILMRAYEHKKDEKKRLQADKKSIKRNQEQLEKADLSQEDYSVAKAECTKKLEEVESRIAILDTFIKKWKKHYELIERAAEKNNEEAIELRRAKAYDIIFPSISAEEFFLKQYIREGTLSDEMRDQLQSEAFCQSVLRFMDNGSYQGFAMPVIMHLYEQGAVDLEAPYLMNYFRTHAQLVSDYLCENIYILFNNDASDDRALLDVVLRIESAHYLDESSAMFNVLWSYIKEPEMWMRVLQFASDLDLPDINDAVYAFMKGLADDASEALVEVLFTPQAQDMHINATEIIGTALRNRAVISPSLVISSFHKMEQLSRSAQRKLRTADRKINGQGQSLFSSVYEPVERLEIIASNMRMSKGTIPCHLIANELVDIATSLRTGMLQMNLHPVCDVEEWRRGYPLPFDADLHRKPMDIEDDPEMVILQTMGFRYLGDDGEWQQYNAQVIPKPVRNASTQPEEQQHRPDTEHADAPPKKKVRKRDAQKGASKFSGTQKPTGRTTPKKPHRKGQKGGPKQ